MWADAHESGTSPQTGYYAVLQAAGELAAKGVSPEQISVRVLFPPYLPPMVHRLPSDVLP